MLEERKRHEGEKNWSKTSWQTPEEVFEWWMDSGVLPGQMKMEDFFEA